MSKPKPPKPANDHEAALGGGDDLDRLTDEELDIRIAAARVAQRRALKLAILRMSEGSVAAITSRLGQVEDD